MIILKNNGSKASGAWQALGVGWENPEAIETPQFNYLKDPFL